MAYKNASYIVATPLYKIYHYFLPILNAYRHYITHLNPIFAFLIENRKNTEGVYRCDIPPQYVREMDYSFNFLRQKLLQAVFFIS